jgi:hypothetical protein
MPPQTSDSTITAVTCLAACEAFRGNIQQLQTHMNGVQKMVEMRGGLTELGMKGLLQSEHLSIPFSRRDVFLHIIP